MYKYVFLIFIRDLQEATQHEKILVNQVAAERLSEKTAEAEAAKYTRADGDDAEECDDDSEGHESDDDDEVYGSCATVTEMAKSKKS